jgi:hypothetical protein
MAARPRCCCFRARSPVAFVCEAEVLSVFLIEQPVEVSQD